MRVLCLLMLMACPQRDGIVVPGIDPGDVDTDALIDDSLLNTPTFLDVVVQPHPTNALIAAVEIETSDPMAVHLIVSSAGIDDVVTHASALATTHRLHALPMRAETTYAITPVGTLEGGGQIVGTPVDFTTGALPSGLPATTVTQHVGGAGAGYTLLGGKIYGDPDPDIVPIFAVDAEGEVVWYWAGAPAQGNPHIIQGDNGWLLLEMGGVARVITPDGDVRIRYEPTTGDKIHHDVAILPNGNLLALGYEERLLFVPPLAQDEMVVGDTLIEITPMGDVVWRWSTLDHLDTSRYPTNLSLLTGLGTDAIDWSHGNGFDYDADDHTVVISLRSQSWLVQVDLDSGLVDWIFGEDGDFTLQGDGHWFSAPHAPELQADGSLLVYDNGNERDHRDNETRAVRYQLDPVNLTATETWSWWSPTYTAFLGDADLTWDGHVLVTAGGDRSVDAVDATSRVVELSLDEPPVERWELTLPGHLYRATRIETFWP